MSRKRYENWMDDIEGMKNKEQRDKDCEELGPPFCECGSGFRFKEGSCVEEKFAEELQKLRVNLYR